MAIEHPTGHASASVPQVVHGIVAKTITATTDPLFVFLPSTANDEAWGPVPWTARSGVQFPKAGDECLIAFDERGNPWLLDLLAPAPAAPAVVSSLPSEPYDGQAVDYLASASLGVIWRFRYRAASASSHKWEFVGGSPLSAEVEAAEATSSGTYGNLATVGPSIAVPLAGDYVLQHGAQIISTATVGWIGFMSFAIGATAASEANVALIASGGFAAASSQGGDATRIQKLTGLGAETLVGKYKAAGASVQFAKRRMFIHPVRVG